MSTESNEVPQVPSPPGHAAPATEPQETVNIPAPPPQAPTASYPDNYVPEHGSSYAAQQAAPYGFQPYSESSSYAPQQPAPVFYPGQEYMAPYGQYPLQRSEAKQLASNGLTMGVIGACLAILIGWIPIFGLVGVAAGLGLGIPAILQSSKSSRLGGEATAGKVTGWIAISFSLLWVAFYMWLMMIGAASGNHTRTTSA